MAKVIDKGAVKPDDPIFKRGWTINLVGGEKCGTAFRMRSTDGKSTTVNMQGATLVASWVIGTRWDGDQRRIP